MVVAVFLTVVVVGLAGQPNLARGLSLGTAWAGLIFFSSALLIGPLNVLRRRPNPVSSYLRRDIGIWVGLLGLMHALLGLTVHLGGDWPRYFIWPASTAYHVPLRYDLFGIANHAGLAVLLLLLLPLALSNDVSVRQLGARRWKVFQRSTYLAALFLLVHGPIYQLIERRLWPYLALFLLTMVLVTAIQVAGVVCRTLHPARLQSARWR